MRTYVAMILIVCGSLLAAAPMISDYAQAVQVSEFLIDSREPGPVQFFRQPLEESYRVGSWILGVAMVSLGIIGGCRRPITAEWDQDREQHTTARRAG